jgi:hypothetical protein
VAGNMYQKTLTLDYDFFDNEFFDLTVIDDGTIKLFQTNSGTVYIFRGLGYIPYLRSSDTQGKVVSEEDKLKKRKQKTERVDNPREHKRG